MKQSWSEKNLPVLGRLATSCDFWIAVIWLSLTVFAVGVAILDSAEPTYQMSAEQGRARHLGFDSVGEYRIWRELERIGRGEDRAGKE